MHPELSIICHQIECILAFKLTYRNSYFFLVLLIFPFAVSKGQDPHFSQFFSQPVYINPAFAGSTFNGRVSLNFRSQWPRIPGEFVTTLLTYDQILPRSNASVAFLAQMDRAGSAGLQSVNLQAIFAYNLKLNEEWRLKAGFQFGFGNRSLNYFNLVFGDQINTSGLSGIATAESNLPNLYVNYLEVGSGFLLYNQKFWLGISGLHLNQPDQSLQLTDIQDNLPMRLSLQAGYRWILDKIPGKNQNSYTTALLPGLHFSKQGKFFQLDLGSNVFIDPVILGIWYRGIPIQNSNRGALALNAGFKYRSFRFLYSYDFAVGKFSSLTGGAHEISLHLLTGDLERALKQMKRRKAIPFPSYIE